MGLPDYLACQTWLAFFYSYIILIYIEYNMSSKHIDNIPAPSPTTTSSLEDIDTFHSDINTNKENNKTEESSKTKRVEWSPENEVIMVEWCDIAQCYKWLNMRSHAKYSYLHAWFTIPAIIFSTLSGTASFAQDSLPPSARLYAPAIIGSINILIGILTTIQQYLKISELNEAHRVAAISWDKFSRNIRIELSKKPSERSDAGSFLKHCRSEFDRLMETSPDITEKVVSEFKTKFAGKEGSDARRKYEQLKKPDICDTIISANETRHKWYLEIDNDVDNMNNDLSDVAMQQKNMVIQEQRKLLAERENELNEKTIFEQKSVRLQIENMKNKQEKQQERDKYIHERIAHIQMYIDNFKSIYERNPLREEIIDNLGNEVEPDIFDIFFASYNSVDKV